MWCKPDTGCRYAQPCAEIFNPAGIPEHDPCYSLPAITNHQSSIINLQSAVCNLLSAVCCLLLATCYLLLPTFRPLTREAIRLPKLQTKIQLQILG